jgi:genome maintenance exonuclease 1
VSETIKRIVLNDFRYYQVAADSTWVGSFPSVTSVLGETSDKSGLDAWRDRIGVDKANEISTDAMKRGTVMHRLCEIYLNLPASLQPLDRLNETLSISRLDDEIDKFDNRAKIVGGALFYNYIRAGAFNDIKKVIAQEKFLWTSRDGGYAGTLDNLSQLINAEYAVIDFKTAKKPKQEKWIEDYKLQVAAYAIAVWDRMQIKVTTCRILISNEASHEPQQFTMVAKDIRDYYLMFRARLLQFYELHPPVRSEPAHQSS